MISLVKITISDIKKAVKQDKLQCDSIDLLIDKIEEMEERLNNIENKQFRQGNIQSCLNNGIIPD